MDEKKIVKIHGEATNSEIISALNIAREGLGMDIIDSDDNLSIEDMLKYFNQVKEEAVDALSECDLYPNRDAIVEILEKDYIPPLDIIKIKNNNLRFAKLIQEDIEDINSKELLDKSDDSIYMYLYQRGWILSRNISPKKIFLYIYVNSQWGNELLRPENLNKIIPIYLKEKNISLIDIIESWDNKLFLERRHIFKECIWAIKEKKYYLAISTLLTQLEGILYSGYGSKVTENNQKGYWNVKQSLNYAFNDEKGSWYKAVHYILENDIYANFGKSFLNSYDENGGYKSNTNRNEILHGININYGDESSLVKVVMLLDALEDIL
ncbi:hypothetical protein [Clostridium sp. LP20]|uniref:hypothetical protein n=1 Tax=Clostridium sp. LP20 TaxID=3418665 RepID=UPI003EE802A4